MHKSTFGEKWIIYIRGFYLLDTINSRVIDYIYHEHLSYHSIKALVPFYKKQNLYICDVIKIPTKGGSTKGDLW